MKKTLHVSYRTRGFRFVTGVAYDGIITSRSPVACHVYSSAHAYSAYYCRTTKMFALQTARPAPVRRPASCLLIICRRVCRRCFQPLPRQDSKPCQICLSCCPTEYGFLCAGSFLHRAKLRLHSVWWHGRMYFVCLLMLFFGGYFGVVGKREYSFRFPSRWYWHFCRCSRTRESPVMAENVGGRYVDLRHGSPLTERIVIHMYYYHNCTCSMMCAYK